MDDIAKKKKKKTGQDCINRDDPDEYMRTREEDFNSIQLIASRNAGL